MLSVHKQLKWGPFPSFLSWLQAPSCGRSDVNSPKIQPITAQLQVVALRSIFFLSALTGAVLATPVHKAVRDNDARSLRQLLSNMNVDQVNALIGRSVSALHVAAAINRGEAAEILIQNGADVDARSGGGFTPLHWAARSDAVDVIKVLVAAGANVNAGAKGGITPLHWAANRNATNAIAFLIAAGANVYQPTNSDDLPLHWAVKKNHINAAELIADKMITDELGSPPTTSNANIIVPGAGPTETRSTQE